MALRARKLSGAFEKRAPGLSSNCINLVRCYLQNNKTQLGGRKCIVRPNVMMKINRIL